MTYLRDEVDREIRDEEKILEYVYRYYVELYAQPKISQEDKREQENTLTLVDQLVSEEDNLRLMEVPGAIELSDTMKRLPLGKSPGEDALPVEVLRELWDDICPCCLKFIQETWHNKRLSKKFLKLEDDPLILPGSLTLRQIKELMRRYSTRRPFNDRVVYPLLKHLGINVLANLVNSAGKWIGVNDELRAKGIQLDQVQCEAIESFQEWLLRVKMGVQKLEDRPSWRWKGLEEGWKAWSQTSRVWHNLFTAEETPDDLSSKWPEGTYALTWEMRW
ncbi:hypothetical protein R1flu_017979 [Riccia fluitans]|uniref:Uncharacterized protein n=1 Tax=Riccia fluitans TaxID=41844 RepID=A0ABD1ZGU6_9MARC